MNLYVITNRVAVFDNTGPSEVIGLSVHIYVTILSKSGTNKVVYIIS